MGCNSKEDEVPAVSTPAFDAEFEAMVASPVRGDFECMADPTCSFKVATKLPGCEVCSNSTVNPWSCEKCCDTCTPEKKAGGMYCNCKSGPSPRDDYSIPYTTTHFHPGQTSKICPTGLQYESLWDEGVGAGNMGGGFGRFMFTMVDRL